MAQCSTMQNQLLAVLSAKVQERISVHLERVFLHCGDVLHESGQPLHHIYFPADGIVSLICETREGGAAEVAIVGNEGLVGVELFMGGRTTTNRAIVRSECCVYRLPTDRLMAEFNCHGELMVQVLRYAQSLMTQMAQNAVCNRHHSITQRLCRRLIGSLDLCDDNRVDMTQELIANMLGVRRESITEVALKLQSVGAIAYRRGQIRVLNRAQLETSSCECYSVVRKETLRLQPYLTRTAVIGSTRSANALLFTRAATNWAPSASSSKKPLRSIGSSKQPASLKGRGVTSAVLVN